MYSSAAGWLMTSLTTDPLMISLVQVAASLPMFLLALPAGTLADIINKKRFLLGAEIYIAGASIAFAVMVWLGLISPWSLLLFTFLIEAGSAATAPPWQSIVPHLVPSEDLAPAVAMNSVGVNISRALGPALGGVLTSAFGVAAPFWVNAASNLGVIGALGWWRGPRKPAESVPAERFASAMRTGVRYAKNNSHLQATLIRAVAFFVFASCYWALLPLVARHQVSGGATLYGVLLGAVGISAIAGAFALPWLKSRLGPNGVVAAGTMGTAATLVLYAVARGPAVAIAASIIAGFCWIAVLANLNVSAQVALPEWVRGRGLATYVTVFFGGMTLGSAIWGEVATHAGVPAALFAAALGALLAIPLTWRWKLQTGARIDLTPSMHWPPPVLSEYVESDAGPVLITVEYRVDPKQRDAFLEALEPLSRERARDGAYAWGIFEDLADTGRFVETFMLESWLEHLRQHARITNADRVLQEQVNSLVTSSPRISHLVAASREDAS
jgi:MFS family permease